MASPAVQAALEDASTEELLSLFSEKRRQRGLIHDLYPDTGPRRRGLYPQHMKFFAEGPKRLGRLAMCANGTGKCVPLDAPVLRSDGRFVPLWSVKPGDEVMAYDLETGRATPSRVKTFYYAGMMEVYETTFTDGAAMRCTREHKMPGYMRSGRYWTGRNGKKSPLQPKVREFHEYMWDRDLSGGCKRSFVTPSETDFMRDDDLPLHPYAVGALIGDGMLRYGTVSFSTADQDILARLMEYLEGEVSGFTKASEYDYRLNQVREDHWVDGGRLNNKLKALGLYHKLAHEKRVPHQYLTASVEDREHLLAGLIDTDGAPEEFCVSSRGLAEDFAFLVRSLGGKASLPRRKKTRCRDAWRVYWRMERRLPLTLDRKQSPKSKRPLDYCRRIIKSIEPVGEHECGCIEVEHPDHCFIAYDWIAVGNTLGMGGYETALHLTGLYPDWWRGIRYDRPVRWWIAGKSKKTTRDYQQAVLLGRPNLERVGGGLIPTDAIDFKSLRRAPQGNGLIDVCHIRHASGGWSELGVRSYDMDLDAFFGANLDGGWMDEPGPILVYSEIVARTRDSSQPCVMVTFTPKNLNAQSARLVELFTEEPDESRIVIPCAWEDVPHLSDSWKSQTLANTPPYMRDTVSKGVVAVGRGNVFPVPEDHFVVEPFEIPDHWLVISGFDGGWWNTAGAWFAWDKDSDVLYLFSEHKAGEMAPPMHAQAFKARGPWIPVIGDARTRSQTDGQLMLEEYEKAGLEIIPAQKARGSITAGNQDVLTRLMTGRLKVFKTCTDWLKEYRVYHYNEDTGEVVKDNDHCMDCTRYAIHEGLPYAVSKKEADANSSPYVPEMSFGRRY